MLYYFLSPPKPLQSTSARHRRNRLGTGKAQVKKIPCAQIKPSNTNQMSHILRPKVLRYRQNGRTIYIYLNIIYITILQYCNTINNFFFILKGIFTCTLVPYTQSPPD